MNEAKEEIIDLYVRHGWSIGELARSYGITRPAMRKRLRKWKVRARSQAEQIALDMTRRRRVDGQWEA